MKPLLVALGTVTLVTLLAVHVAAWQDVNLFDTALWMAYTGALDPSKAAMYRELPSTEFGQWVSSEDNAHTEGRVA